MELSDIAVLTNRLAEVVLDSRESVDRFRQEWTGKKGQIAQLFDSFRSLPPDEKRKWGNPLNALKTAAEEKEKEALELLAARQAVRRPLDLTLPGAPFSVGARHPVSVVERRVIQIFERLGFVLADGPEIEDDWHNFTALNFPPNHPARDMQDTFFVSRDPDRLLRTHTTSVQVRWLENHTPPIRILMPGRVYRNEVVTARSHCYFHQIDGVYVDRNVSFNDLRLTLLTVVRQLFGAEAKIRLRPSYFPFTEISAEVDVSCFLCHGAGCNICKHTGWIEILGCGMIDPNVLANCGIDPEEFSGFAFGMGLERLTLNLFRIPDLRLFSQNDLRMLRRFSPLSC